MVMLNDDKKLKSNGDIIKKNRQKLKREINKNNDKNENEIKANCCKEKFEISIPWKFRYISFFPLVLLKAIIR